MRELFFAATIFATATATAFAQAPPNFPTPTGKDRVHIVDADQMPLPPPKKELLRMQSLVSKADDGISGASNAPELVRQFFNNLEIIKGQASTAEEAGLIAGKMQNGTDMPTAPLVLRNITDLKLAFAPSNVRSGRLIGVAPQGTIVNGAWTGVERYFELAGGYSRVSETDMALSGGMFFMNKAAVNARVAGKPAISMVYTDARGLRVEEVLWVNGGKLFKLTYAPNLQQGRYGMMKASSGISALSLAAELR